jgi:probable HAF family extracellular repeat protein
MKSRMLIGTIAISLLATLAGPLRLAAQEQQEHNKKLPRYRVIDLGTLGGTVSGALAINSKGWVTGFSFLPGDANLHALLWRRGVKTDLGTLGGPNSTPNGFMDSASVNERGEIAGAAESSAADPLGENFFLCNFPDGLGLLCLPFLWEDGAMMPLPTLGGNNGAAFQINNRGQAVGAAENTTHDPTCVAPQVLQFKPVIWEEGVIQELPTISGDPDGVAFAINDRGQAVGVSADCTLTPGHALLWQDGNVTDMGTLSGLALAPTDINNQSQVVGTAFDNANTNRAFLWQNGVAIDLGTLPGDVMGHANAINDKGQVIGQSVPGNSLPRGFIWQNGVMTDLNTLISADSNLYLFDPQDINSRGEIVGQAIEKNTGAFLGFLSIPCNEEADKEACEDQAGSTFATGRAIGDKQPFVFPESVPKVLQQRLSYPYRFTGLGMERD